MKKEKPVVFCYGCKEEIRGKVSIIAGQKNCFKCLVRWRVADRARQAKESQEWVTTWIRVKKYFCPTCRERRSDLGVSHSVAGNHCTECGTICQHLKVELPVQLIPKID